MRKKKMKKSILINNKSCRYTKWLLFLINVEFPWKFGRDIIPAVRGSDEHPLARAQKQTNSTRFFALQRQRRVHLPPHISLFADNIFPASY